MSDTSTETLSGRVALVTGASRGLGRAIAVALSREGAFVAVNYLQHHREAGRTLAEVGEARGALYPADVRDAAQVGALFDRLYRERGGVDILVNNAGITRDEPFVPMGAPGWHAVIDTDLTSAFLCARAAIRRMCAARRGVIVNIGSGSGLSPRPGQVNYSSAKSALIGFSRSLAREVAGKGVRVNVVAPGFTSTPMTQSLPAPVIGDSIRRIPIGRWGEPEEIAAVVAYVASDDAAFLTGQTLVVDGGRAAMEQDYGF